jgi:hypothetical protein
VAEAPPCDLVYTLLLDIVMIAAKILTASDRILLIRANIVTV